MTFELPEPLQSLSTLRCPSVTQQPERRFRDIPEHYQEEEVEQGREAGDKPPGEDGSYAVGGQHTEANH